MNVLLKNATIVDSTNKNLHLKKRDILVKNGVIDKIASKITPPNKTKIIDYKNLHVSLGWFDSSVSFGEPGYEERETIENGLKTAARSGFTDIVLNPNTNPVPDSSSDIVFLKNTAKYSVNNLHPLGTLTAKGEGKHLAEMFDMKNAGAVGFYDFKRSIENSNLLKIALQYAQNFDGLVHSFPMDTKIAGKGVVNEGEVSTKMGLKGIPVLAEELQIARDIFILEYTGGKLHIPTISTTNSVKLIADAKKKGLDVSCSVAIHNLFMIDASLEEYDTNCKVMPPLRTKKDIKALIKGVKEGVIDFVCSDHIPMNIEEKRVEFDNATDGSLGLETTFGILNQIFDLEKSIELLTRGRERYQLQTPVFKEGEIACLTLFNPEEEFTFTKEEIVSTSNNSMYLGKLIKGRVFGVICNNQILI
ncbi:dihydroorotase [Maribacter algarum]|uniref:Dihydroorotase n=1 Tax=Maribacter algarum (ex Zhang et al. 2020) TaxID=2578118 RepID=A0A5S3PVN0_9FLAO|nr:dihydroorotase [Maribacter algarum]TMM57038.1 dihydroorotase [Maribacter algarum]